MTVAALRKKREKLDGPGRIRLRGVHRPFSALQSPQPRRIAWHAFPKARQAPSQRDQAIAVRSMVARQLWNPGRRDPWCACTAARGCAPASACRAGMALALALTLPPSRHTIAVYCKHGTCFHVSFYVLGDPVAGKRPQSLRALHVCSTATHHEGYTHAHTVTQRASWCACALPCQVASADATLHSHRQRHALWLWECGARALGGV